MKDKINEQSTTLLIEDEKSNHKLQLKKELMYFKNDLLKDFNVIESKINEKYSDTINDLKLRLNDYDKKFSTLNQKFSDLTNSMITEKTVKDKIEQLNQFKESINGKIVSHEIKLNLTYNELQNSITKYDKLFGDSVIYTGIIGKSCKFQNFHEFIDYVLQQIYSFNSYKEKSSLNFNLYKQKLETLIDSLKLQITNITSTLTEFTTKNVNDCENRMKNEINIYNDKLSEIRLQNKNYHDDLNNKFNNLIIDWEKVLEIKKEIYSKFDADVEKFKIENNKLSQKLEENQSEFNLIKDRFTKLSEFIKDVRFRKNIGQEVKLNEFTEISKKIDFIRKQVYDENESNNLIQKNTKGQQNISSTYRRENSDSNLHNIFNKNTFIRKNKRSNTLNYDIKKNKDFHSLENINQLNGLNKIKKEENKKNIMEDNINNKSNEQNIDFNEFKNINELYGKKGFNEKNRKKTTIHSIREEENDFILNFEDDEKLSFNDIKSEKDNNIGDITSDNNYKTINDDNINKNQNNENKYYKNNNNNDNNKTINGNINLDTNSFNITIDDNTINNNNPYYIEKKNDNKYLNKNNKNETKKKIKYRNENNNISHNDSFRSENKTFNDIKNKLIQNELNISKRENKKITEFSSPFDKVVNDKSLNNYKFKKKNSSDSCLSLLTPCKSFNNLSPKLRNKIKDKQDENEESNNVPKSINEYQVKNKNVILSPRNKESFLKSKNILFDNILYSTIKDNEKKSINSYKNKEAGIYNINFDDKVKVSWIKGIENNNNNFKTAKIKLDDNIKLYELKKLHFKKNRNFSDEHLSVINKKKKIKINDNKILSETHNSFKLNNHHIFEEKLLYFPHLLPNFENGK